MNKRLHQAIYAIRILGRNSETMGEFYDSLNARRELKTAKRASNDEFSNFMKLCRR
jgi:hypothetical protein